MESASDDVFPCTVGVPRTFSVVAVAGVTVGTALPAISP